MKVKHESMTASLRALDSGVVLMIGQDPDPMPDRAEFLPGPLADAMAFVGREFAQGLYTKEGAIAIQITITSILEDRQAGYPQMAQQQGVDTPLAQARQGNYL